MNVYYCVGGTQVPRGTFVGRDVLDNAVTVWKRKEGRTHARLDEAREKKEGSSEREISFNQYFPDVRPRRKWLHPTTPNKALEPPC